MTAALRTDGFKAHGSKEKECGKGWVGTKKYKGSTGPGCRRSTSSKAAKARRAAGVEQPVALKKKQKERAGELAARIRAKKAPAMAKGKARRSANEARAAEKKARIMERMGDRVAAKKRSANEVRLVEIPRTEKEFAKWADKTKKRLNIRNLTQREGPQKSLAERQKDWYQTPEEYLAGELKGYKISKDGEVKDLQFRAAPNKSGGLRRLSMDDAIKESQRLFAEHQDRWNKELRSALEGKAQVEYQKFATSKSSSFGPGSMSKARNALAEFDRANGKTRIWEASYSKKSEVQHGYNGAKVHEAQVKKAIERGDPVPQSVRDEYPSLKDVRPKEQKTSGSSMKEIVKEAGGEPSRKKTR